MNAKDTLLPIEETSHVTSRHERNIGGILAEGGKLGDSDIKRVLDLQQKQGLRFGEAALHLGLISEDELRNAVARQYELPQLLSANDSASRELVAVYAPFDPRAEEIRALRTQ